jgi:hypothetical protein
MGAMSRSKGKRGEREVVALARAAGLDAQRTWETAQSRDARERRCDVRIAGRPFQVKRQRDGFAGLYDALRDVDGAFVRADGREWLVVLCAERFLELLKGNKEKAGHHRLEATLAWLKARRASRDNGRHQS